ncbi:MAG: DUF1552 domain-containing protein [Myxococcaceae bacterium]
MSRRAMLKGLGAMVALPTLEAMLNSHGTAFAAGDPLPRRMATWFFGNGVVRSKWVPAATGSSWELSDALASLANVKSYVNVVSGCVVKIPDRRVHHTGCGAMLAGYPFIELNTADFSSKFGGPTIDQVAADIIGKTTFPSLQLSVTKRATPWEGPTLQYLSHRGPDAPLPAETNPVNLFNKLFGNYSAPADDPKAAVRASVLDAVKEDAKRLQQRLGANDRRRVDAHLTAISEVRQQLLALPSEACTPPPAVSTTNRDVNGAEPMEAVNKAMADLLAIAWACDLNRVASFMFSGSVGDCAYPMLGIPDNQHHITHDDGRRDEVHECVKFYVKNFAYLLERLQATPDGTGNLLDNSVVMMTTDVSEGWSHSLDDFPILLAGRAGGTLKSPGIHYRSTNGRSTSDVLLTVMQAAGTGVTSVGAKEGLSTTPVRELMV